MFLLIYFSTLDRRHSKTLLTINEHGSEIATTSVFDCHLSPVGRVKAIKYSVLYYLWSTFADNIDVFDCRLHVSSLVLRWTFLHSRDRTSCLQRSSRAAEYETTFYQYFNYCISRKITFNNCKIVVCSHIIVKDKKIQSFSFPNNNDKHLEISVFAVTLRESAGTKC